MIDAVARTLQAKTGGKSIALVALCCVILAVIMTKGGTALEELSGGASVLDLRFRFTEAEAYSLMGTYGEEGRRLYALMEAIDMVYPIAIGTLLALVLAYVGNKALPEESPLRKLCALPLLGLTMDYLENTGTVTMALTYPERWPRLGTAAGLFNAAKWTVHTVGVTLVVAGLVVWLIKSLRGDRPA